MSRAKEIDGKTRVVITCSARQKELIDAAAKRSGCASSLLALTYTLRAIAAPNGHGPAEDPEAPLILPGRLGAIVRQRATEQGVTPERALEMMLVE